MPDRIFTPEQLADIGVPFDCDSDPEDGFATELHREQIDTRRWVSIHRLVFRAPDDDRAYSITYKKGLTEEQEDTDPWDTAHQVTAIEVEPREITVTKWVPIHRRRNE